MQKIKFSGFIALLAIFLMSCSKKSKLENSAKEHMATYLKEKTKDPTNFKLTDARTVYSDDSLCIIYAYYSDIKEDKDVIDSCEYIYLASSGKFYESKLYIRNDDDHVFSGLSQYEKKKKGTFYESLNYESGLRYLATIDINQNGHEVGVLDGEPVSVPTSTGTGSWNLYPKKDEFGEPTSSKFLLLMGRGIFSNPEGTNPKMTGALYLEKDGKFSISMVTDNAAGNAYMVRTADFYDFMIKDSTGEIYETTLYNSGKTGRLQALRYNDFEMLKLMLTKEGIITVVARVNGAYPDTYPFSFKLDATGYNKALTYL